MTASPFERLAGYLAANDVIAADDQELYAFSLQQGAVFLANLCTSLLIGQAMHMLLASILFILCYLPLRTYSGGFHARTQLSCYFSGIGLTVITLIAIKLLQGRIACCIVMTLLACSLIFCLAPVEDCNKPLSPTEFPVYRKIARTIMLVEVVMFLISLVLHQNLLTASIAVALAAAAALLLWGKMNPRQQAKTDS